MRARPRPSALLVLALLASTGLAVVAVSGVLTPAPPPAGRSDAAVAADPAVPVAVAAVVRRDVPLLFDGIGTAHAVATVIIGARVDGELLSVNFAEGQEVRPGDVLAQLDPRPFAAKLRQAVAALHRDQARLVSAQADLSRLRELVRGSFASRQSLETQQAATAALTADIEADQAMIDDAQVQLDYTTIRSPIAGRTGFRQVDLGNIVHAGDRSGIVVVTQLAPIEVVFDLPENDLPAVRARLGEAAQLAVSVAGHDDRAPLATGTLMTIDSAIDQRTGTFRLKARFANADRALWPGQFLTARLLVTTRPGAVVIPAEAVQYGPDGPYAFVITAQGTAELRRLTVASVQAGGVQDGAALIGAGVQPGERVVVDGQERLRDGSRVTIPDLP